MEKVVKIINSFCTFPVIEKVKLFKLTLFNFLIGNEDMHLKNFSVITNNGKVELSPHYDLLNTTIALKHAREEFALPISGKKNNLNKKLFVEYFGVQILEINQKTIDKTLSDIFNARKKWISLINASFLDNEMKEKYLSLLHIRWIKIFN